MRSILAKSQVLDLYLTTLATFPQTFRPPLRPIRTPLSGIKMPPGTCASRSLDAGFRNDSYNLLQPLRLVSQNTFRGLNSRELAR